MRFVMAFMAALVLVAAGIIWWATVRGPLIPADCCTLACRTHHHIESQC